MIGNECLDNVETLVKKYEDSHNSNIVKHTKTVMNIVKDYIKKHNLILYGGFALNELLPKSKKFYNDNTKVKDYDCYCVGNVVHGKNIVNLLIDEGFKYVVMKRGFSKDTVKIFVEFVSVCDLTEINPELFEYYKDISTKKNGMLLASTDMIKSSMCMELAQPHLSYYRWEKMLPRFKLVCEEFKEKNVKIPKIMVDDNIELYKDLLSVIKKNNIPLTGILGYKLHNNEPIMPFYKYGNKMATISVLCKSSSVYILNRCLKKHALTKIVNKNNSITYVDKDGNFILDIYLADDRCVTICKKNGYQVLSVIGMLYLIYDDYITFYNNDNKDIEKLKYLVYKLLNNMKCTDKCFMGLECYGDFTNIFRLRKEKWDDIGLKYKPARQNKNKSIFS